MRDDGYHLDLDSGDFFAKNFSLFSNRKNNLFYGEEHVRVNSDFPVAPFESTTDFQNKLKAPLVMAIVSVGSLLTSALSAVKNIALLVVNLIAFDFEQADTFSIKAFIDIMGAGYAAFSVIVDTCSATASLITQALITGYVWVAGDAWEAESDVDMEATGFSESFLNTSCATIKTSLSKEDGLEEYLENHSIGFFLRFNADFQTQFKAPLVIPISYLTGALGVTMGAVTKVALAVVNCAVLDFHQAGVDSKVAWHSFEIAIYFVLNAIADTLYATLKLATRTLATADSAIGEAIDRFQEPSAPSLLLAP